MPSRGGGGRTRGTGVGLGGGGVGREGEDSSDLMLRDLRSA